jgi:hypothetical protein
MAEEEPEEKEYRWETGYEKTWYVFMLRLLRQRVIIRVIIVA